MTTAERLAAIASQAALFEPWTGPFTRQDLEELIAAEFATPDALDRPQIRNGVLQQLLVPETILHVVSGNTPHAAFQTLLRGLIIGAHNRIKLPSAGLPAFETALTQLHPALNPHAPLRVDGGSRSPRALWQRRHHRHPVCPSP
jgi:hypothetical protein